MAGLNKLQLQVFGRQSINLLNKIVTYWKFDGNSNDSTGNGHNGTDTNISYVSGKIADAASFNGTSSDIVVPDSDDLSFTDGVSDIPFTISCWFKKTDTINGVIIAKRNGNVSPAEYQLNIFSPTEIRFENYSGDSIVNRYRFIGAVSISTGNWYHLVIVSDAANGVCRMYLNGSEITVTRVDFGSYVAMVNGSSPVSIGRTETGTAPTYHNGQIDEMGIWRRKLTKLEILRLYNSGNGLSFPF